MSEMQQFTTGATRSADGDKNDYEGFLSPLVIEAYGDYMTQHRTQADGVLRDSDNWQKGMPLANYIKSLFRHFVDLWKLNRGLPVADPKGRSITKVEACCAILFNVMGYLHELLKPQEVLLEGPNFWTDRDTGDEIQPRPFLAGPMVSWGDTREKAEWKFEQTPLHWKDY